MQLDCSDQEPVSARLLVGILLALGSVALAVYAPALRALPSADDFIIPLAVRSAEERGPWQFFYRSPLEDYRPLQWITAWVATRTLLENPWPALHLLNFACFVAYVAVLALWLLRLRLAPVPATCAAAFIFFHPVLAGLLVDFDCFTRFLTSSCIWLGAYAADRLASRLTFGIPIVAAFLAVGLGMTEYAVGLLVLAPTAVWWQRHRGRVAGAAIMAGALLVVLLAYLAARHAAIGRDHDVVTLNPVGWLSNMAMMSAAILYPGNTVSIALSEDSSRHLWLAGGCALVALWIAAGLRLRHAQREEGEASLLYLTALLAGSFVPMVARADLSEVYVTAPLFALALLVGRAAEGWCVRRGVRWPAFAALAVVFGWGIASASAKEAAMVERGVRADRLIRSLQAQIPASLRDTTVWLVYPEGQRRYSVFVCGDEMLIDPPRHAAEWFFPRRGIKLKHVVGRRSVPPGEEPSVFVLCWVSTRDSFHRAFGGTCPESWEGLPTS